MQAQPSRLVFSAGLVVLLLGIGYGFRWLVTPVHVEDAEAQRVVVNEPAVTGTDDAIVMGAAPERTTLRIIPPSPVATGAMIAAPTGSDSTGAAPTTLHASLAADASPNNHRRDVLAQKLDVQIRAAQDREDVREVRRLKRLKADLEKGTVYPAASATDAAALRD